MPWIVTPKAKKHLKFIDSLAMREINALDNAYGRIDSVKKRFKSKKSLQSLEKYRRHLSQAMDAIEDIVTQETNELTNRNEIMFKK